MKENNKKKKITVEVTIGRELTDEGAKNLAEYLLLRGIRPDKKKDKDK